MLKYCFFLATLYFTTQAFAQITFWANELPANTPANAELYISGSFDNWSGGNASYKMSKNTDKTYSITLPQQTGTINFKFTRGTWASVEKSATGAEIANRTYTFGGNGATINIKINTWADLTSGGGGGGATSTAASNVRILATNFSMPQFTGRTRKIWLYLPPNYQNTTISYPVLYMHDGQNLFDNLTSFAGEWQVDEALNTLYAQTGLAVIVVGIENGGSERINEYTPWANATYGGGEGGKYMNFVAQTLKPYIDNNYRTLPAKQHTALIGSSLGGLISHFGALEHAQIFGKIGVFSPSFWFSESAYTFAQSKSNLQDTKMYFLAGGAESAAMVSDIERMISTMKNTGFAEANILKKIVPAGTHSEGFWRSELSEAIQWLFNNAPLATEKIATSAIKIYPNPTNDEITIQPQDIMQTYQLEIFNFMGVKMWDSNFSGTYKLPTAYFHKGSYLFKISTKQASFTQKIIKR